MYRLRKLISSLLVLSMIFSLELTSYAAENTDNDKFGVTVMSLEEYNAQKDISVQDDNVPEGAKHEQRTINANGTIIYVTAWVYIDEGGLPKFYPLNLAISGDANAIEVLGNTSESIHLRITSRAGNTFNYVVYPWY